MDYSEVFGQRLRNARIMKGYSMEELSNRIGNAVSKMSISKYESGKMTPGSEVVLKFAEALDLPVDFFFRPFQFEISEIQFRKKSTLSKKQEDSIKETVADKIERYINIEEICNSLVPFEKPEMIAGSEDDVKQHARKLRKEWKLGEDGIVNVIELLEEHGIKVVEVDAPQSFDGFSAYVNREYPVIVLNNSFPSERKRLTAAHELGHLVLSLSPDLSHKDVERYCYVFGNEFLMPERVFVSIVGKKRGLISYPELSAIQRCFGLSCDALMRKASDSGIIRADYYTSYCKRKNSSASFKQQFEQSIYPEEYSERFERLVYRALSSELISEGKAAALLNVPLETVKKTIALS